MGFGKVFKKIRKVAAKFDLGHQVGKKMGLPDPSGDALYGSDKALSPAEQAQKNQEAAQKAATEEAALARQQAQQQADNLAQMQANFQTDLKGENMTNVIAGGTADLAGDSTDIN